MTIRIPHRSKRNHLSPRHVQQNRLASVSAWTILMKECSILGPASTFKLNKDLNISLRILQQKYRKYQREIYLNIPPSLMTSIHDQRGIKSQIFTPPEEEKLANHIRAVMNAGIEVVDKSWIRNEAIKFYNECRRGQRNTRSNDVIPFTASDGWIARFKARHQFSRSHPKIIKRLSAEKKGHIVSEYDAKLDMCVQAMEAMEKYGLDCVLNFDETPASVVEKPKSCWGMGGKSGMKIFSDASPKTSISLLPIITASGDRLPLAWIARGKTQKCLDKMYNIPKNIFSYFNQHGWNTEEIMVRLINDIIRPYLDGRPGALILDAYRAHWTQKVLEAALKINLELILVPKGFTSVCQPLDMTFNAAFKLKRQTLWKEERAGGIEHTDNVERTVMRAAKAYDLVSSQVISQGFAAICPPLAHQIMQRYVPRI